MENCFFSTRNNKRHLAGIVLKEKNEEKSQFSSDFEGNSGNSHFRAMCALYFLQHSVQIGTFQRYILLTNK